MPQTKTNSSLITELLNATLLSIKNVVPMTFDMQEPQRLMKDFHLNFGVLIGTVGDLNGKLVFSGDMTVFSKLGEVMYGMPLEGEMLQSFSGEIGNMIAGGISTHLAKNQTEINITPPTILQGDTTLSGYKQGIQLNVHFMDAEDFSIYLLLD